LNIYEGMFVVDDKRANDNWDRVVREIRSLLEKHQAQIFHLERWDDRRLAYRIKGRNRAVYVLTGFTAPHDAIPPIERDCQLDDTILRVLFLRDHQHEKLRKLGLFDPHALKAEAEAEQPAPKPEAAAKPAEPEAAQPAPAAAETPPEAPAPVEPPPGEPTEGQEPTTQ